MRVFITGANGFIGGYLTAALLQAGHELVAGVRRPEAFRRRFPQVEAVDVDFTRDQDAGEWKDRLQGIDAVINCAGILHGREMQAVHVAGPKAMFQGAALAGVGKLVHISAISADREAGTAYASSKNEADEHLQSLDIDWTILRPSLVYASGAYGGTALLRALAALPLAIPLAGKGDQPFQPIHCDDVARTVIQALNDPRLSRQVIDAVGPETLTLADILLALRGWLGLSPVPTLKMPMPLINLVASLGGLLGSGPVNPTSVRQLVYGNVGNPETFQAAVGWRPRSFTEGLGNSPAQTQDLWHARAYFLAPLLKYVLALLWLGSGIVGLISGGGATGELFEALHLPSAWVAPATVGTSVLDIAIGVLLLSGRRIGALCLLQFMVVLAYTGILTLGSPELWLDPFGALLKNIPILALILVYAAIGRSR
jgi:uncharacterized protein YbjT (DUF2867 family)